jgi:AcrR family transcriptional regulator
MTAMSAAPLQEARAELVRDRVMEGAAAVLADGEPLTFTRVAAASGVAERTVYRHFPDREALLSALYAWINDRAGIDARPSDGAEAAAVVRRTFPAFDEHAAVLRELLHAPEGLAARLADNEARQRAAIAVVAAEAPGLPRRQARRIAAVVQLLSSATAWQALRDYWDLDGAEAAEAAALAIDLVLAGARADR